MTIAFIFWFMMLLWLVGGLWYNRADWQGWGMGNLFQFILFFLLGWKVFGFPIHG